MGQSMGMAVFMAVLIVGGAVFLFIGKSCRKPLFIVMALFGLLLAYVNFGSISSIALAHRLAAVLLGVVSAAAWLAYFRWARLALAARLALIAAMVVSYLDVFVF